MTSARDDFCCYVGCFISGDSRNTARAEPVGVFVFLIIITCSLVFLHLEVTLSIVAGGFYMLLTKL
jgi:hypothetical protein